jgi:hypothetical protein
MEVLWPSAGRVRFAETKALQTKRSGKAEGRRCIEAPWPSAGRVRSAWTKVLQTKHSGTSPQAARLGEVL